MTDIENNHSTSLIAAIFLPPLSIQLAVNFRLISTWIIIPKVHKEQKKKKTKNPVGKFIKNDNRRMHHRPDEKIAGQRKTKTKKKKKQEGILQPGPPINYRSLVKIHFKPARVGRPRVESNNKLGP